VSAACVNEALADLRRRRGITQQDLAQMLGTKQPAISRLEQPGYDRWNYATVRKAVEVLGGRITVVVEG
jgi:predicted transcriptional regulator